MKIVSILEDKRIKAANILVEFEIGEYLQVAETIIKNNPFQRKRVKSSSTVYSLLREDLKQGCIIPPIVLALGKQYDEAKDQKGQFDEEKLYIFINQNIGHSLILDGLQRTYNIIDANDELLKNGDTDGAEIYYHNKIRCEFYIGIDKIGILYRMLTLNTGQTPMSLRHQIEILYSDYLQHTYDGIKLIREIDERIPRNVGEYNFKDVIEGFTSYLLRDYLTFDRSDILENIKSLEKLSKESEGIDIFKSFIQTYHHFLLKTQELLRSWTFNEDDLEFPLGAPPFGKNASAVFNKSQVMTGLGAAVGFLKDRDLNSFDKIIADMDDMKEEGTEWANQLIYKLDDIRKNAPKIGNAQREYFFYFFRELFNPEGDSYLKLNEAVESAFKRYKQNA